VATVAPPVWIGDELHVLTYVDDRPADVPESAFVMLRFWEAKGDDDTPPEVTRLTETDGAAAILADRRARARLDRAEFLLAALGAGLISEDEAEAAATGNWPIGFDAFLAGMSSAERIAAKASWTDSREIRRDSPLLAQIAGAVGLDDAGLDAMFGIAQ